MGLWYLKYQKKKKTARDFSIYIYTAPIKKKKLKCTHFEFYVELQTLITSYMHLAYQLVSPRSAHPQSETERWRYCAVFLVV